MAAQAKISLQNSVFLFRHITNGQVVPSRSNVLKLDNVWNHLKEPVHKLRKDHWKPIAVVSGFEDLRTADIVWHSLTTYPNPIRDEKWITLPKRLRRVQELDQAEHKLSALCRILTELPEHSKDNRVFPEGLKGDLNLTILWETEHFKNLPQKQGLSWPEFINHQKLNLIRGRNLANQELNTTHSGVEKLIKLQDMHKQRIESKKELTQ